MLRYPLVGLFTKSPALESQVIRLLPLILAVVVTDALQAVTGFGLVGLKRTGPSLVSTAVWFGILAALAVPVTDTAGLPGLWTALACANLLQASTKWAFLLRHSAHVGAPVPSTASGGNPTPVPQDRGKDAECLRKGTTVSPRPER
ncbi:hypothetical protein [Streptomyces sp. NPDC096142]|uniref:hypothetical protein n=1 Tax=Streptomyces sp. NPDC096142 TaxID=3366077 RepID=UPI0038230CD3